MAKNFAKTAKMVERAARMGAQIICLQELYNTPYFPQYPKLKDKDKYTEYIPGASTTMFSWLAEDYGVVIIVPIFEKHGQPGQKKGWKYYNSATVIDHRGKLMKEVYHKIHIPYDPRFYEKNYFRPGDNGYKVYQTRFGKIGVLICYDQWFPEAARAVALNGAEIIFYPTAIGDMAGHRPKEGNWHDAWETVMRGHAIANSVHVAAVNRVGREGELAFWGQSFICDSFGKVLKRASASKDEVLLAKVNLNQNRGIRDSWGFFENRRPDTYNPLIKQPK